MDQRFRRLAVPFSRASPGAARSELSRTLQGLQVQQGVIDDAVLVGSELVTNAVRHATPAADGQLGVEWAIDASRLWLRVSDGGRREDETRRRRRDAVGGRGFSIVAALADAWDFEPHEAGTSVTAVFDLV